MVRFLLNRPIAVIITTISLVLLGLVSLRHIPVSLLPDIAVPELTVQISYPSVAADELYNTVVKPVTSHVQQVGNLVDLEVVCQDGLANIKLNLSHGTDIDLAYIEVNEKIDRAIAGLPKDLHRPKVIKAGAADIPVFNLSVRFRDNAAKSLDGSPGVQQPARNTSDFLALSSFSENVIRRRIEQLTEVALVDISGIAEPEVAILPNQKALHNLGITERQFIEIVRKNNIEFGSILVKDEQYQYNIKVSSVLKSPEDILDIAFKIPKSNTILTIADVATVQVREQKKEGSYTFDGERAIVLSIIKQTDAQLLDLREKLGEVIADLSHAYPGLVFSVSQDQTELLDLSIDNLVTSLCIGGLCAFVVIFLFLKSFRTPFLIGLVIPVSVLITFLFFYLLHISINIVSLAGLVLGIGMVVDSAIIVVENIDQMRQEGASLEDACVTGTNEVMLPLFTSVLTNSAVFIPLVFLSGIAGALFLDQALSVTIALAVSLLCSFTLIPVLYKLVYQIPSARRNANAPLQGESYLMRCTLKLYTALFNLVFNYKRLTLLLIALFLGSSIFIFFDLKKTGMPTISQTELQVAIDWNEPVTIEENNRRINRMLVPLQGQITYWNVFAGQQQFLLNKELYQSANQATLFIKVPDNERYQQVSLSLQEAIHGQYPNAVVELSAAKNVFELLFDTQEEYLVLQLSNKQGALVPDVSVIEEVSNNIMFAGYRAHAPVTQPRVYVTVLKDRLLLYNVEYETLVGRLKTLFNENIIGNLKGSAMYMPMVIGGAENSFHEIISHATVSNSTQQEIPLIQLIRLQRQYNYKSIYGGKNGEFIPIQVEVAGDEPETVLRRMNLVLEKFPNIQQVYTGSYIRNQQYIRELGFTLLLSVGLLFFILSAQFESLIQPVIIMLTVLLGASGSIALLYITGNSLNIMSLIGIVVMIGIVDNDSILKLDTMNRQRQTHSLLDSIKLAGKRRLKAQLMTSLSTILALVPTLFASGLGSELQAPLAISVIGGITVGTVVSVTFVPLLYWFIYRYSENKDRQVVNV